LSLCFWLGDLILFFGVIPEASALAVAARFSRFFRWISDGFNEVMVSTLIIPAIYLPTFWKARLYLRNFHIGDLIDRRATKPYIIYWTTEAFGTIIRKAETIKLLSCIFHLAKSVKHHPTPVGH
jgi:hypothetical protein